MNPYLFATPIAPHIAAERTNRRIDLQRILRAYRTIAARSDTVIVEGAGGLLVPLNANSDTADLARRMRLPVLLVVGMRLGCLSHALMTAAVIAARGLTFAGWFANRIDPRMREYRGNVETLRRRLHAPLLGELPYRAQSGARRIAIDRVLAHSSIVQSSA
jgi:dethiobiotin synthetase